jgi:DNA-binding MarR family transcriptional regulator
MVHEQDRARHAPHDGPSAAALRSVVSAAERLIDAVHARSFTWMLQLGLTMPQLRTLLTIRRLGQANGRQLAAALGVTPGAIVAIGDHLEEHGYVRRVIDRGDRRITWFELSDQALAALTAPPALAAVRARTKAVIAGLSAEEREGFVKVADAFTEALEAIRQATEDQTRPPRGVLPEGVAAQPAGVSRERPGDGGDRGDGD